MMLRTAVVLCVAALCCLSPFCQAFPQLWNDELAREEEGRIAAVNTLRSVARALIEQNSEGECPLEIFNFTGVAMPLQTRDINDVVFENNKYIEVLVGKSLDYKCQLEDNYRLYVRKNGKDFERATKPNGDVVNETEYECRLASGATYRPSINAQGEPRCIPLCKKLNALENGSVRVTRSGPELLVGSTANYSCLDGYQLQGSQTRTCGEDGQWSGQEPTCIPLCPMLEDKIVNGYLDNPTNRRPGAEATYSCNTGPGEYVLEGSPRNCTKVAFGSRAIWLPGDEPQCIPLCPELPDTIGNVSVNRPTNRRPGAMATYSCRKDVPGEHVLDGPETKTCTEDADREMATWLPSGNPKCVPLCPEPRLPTGDGYAEGEVSLLYGHRKPGDVASHTCERYAQLVGPATRTCGEDGKWSGSDPYCIPIICSADSLPIADGEFSPSRDLIRAGPGGRRGYGVGTVITYRCTSDHFELQGESSIICLESGEWSHPPPRCVPLKVCRIPRLRTGEGYAKGGVKYGNRKPGDVANYTCERYAELVGPETRTCLEDGTWSGIDPYCIPIICSPDSLPITDGEFSPSGGLIRAGPGGKRGYGVGTVVNYRCTKDRFELRGESSIICQESGEWSHPPPRCVAAKCPELRLSGNPRSVDETRRQIERDRPRDYKLLLIKSFFEKKIEGNPNPYDEGSKAYLTCINGWKWKSDSPPFQTCVRNPTTGELYWTDSGICWYKYYIIRPAFTVGTG